MAKRVMWKKGMRLTDEILILSDKCTEELVSRSLTLGACGRMGLLPGIRKFSISLDINNDVIEVVSIDCLGLTRNGRLIDIQGDTKYSNSFDTRIIIPSQNTDEKFYLCISANDDVRDTNDGLCETMYTFILIGENSPVPESSLPIARIIYDEFCWRADEFNFVPPCLYITSHLKYEELFQKFFYALKEINQGLPQQLYTEKGDAVKIFWPLLQQIMISVDKNRDTMTPMSLLSCIQKLVSAFYCACCLDECITISDPEQYISYINTSYNFRDVYNIICSGVNLVLDINEKIKAFCVESDQVGNDSLLPPTIEKSQLRQMIKYGSVKIKVINNTPGSTIYYTTDGSMPSQSSRFGDTIIIESGFTDDWHKEPQKDVTIKVVAYKDGQFSEIETYHAQIKKGNPFSGKQI